MAKKDIRSDQDTIYGDLIRRIQEGGVEIPEFPIEDLSENPPAKSQWATGRGCPKDSHPLVYFEINDETGVQWYECSYCRRRYTENELATDALYRHIPEDAILRYVEDMTRKGR